jgi:hypothetical protein
MTLWRTICTTFRENRSVGPKPERETYQTEKESSSLKTTPFFFVKKGK